MNTQIVKKSNIYIILIVLLLFSTVLSVYTGSTLQPNIINGKYTLLVTDTSDTVKQISGVLEKQDGLEVISRYNTTVTVNLFSTAKSIPVYQINDILSEFDPRNTDFTRNIGSLFYSEHKNTEILYITYKFSSDKFKKEIVPVIEELTVHWSCPEFTVNSSITQIILIIIYIIFLSIYFRKIRIFPFLILPWVGTVLSGRYDLLCMVFSVIFIIAVFTELISKQKERNFKKILNLIPAAKYFVISISFISILFIVSAATAAASATVIFSLFSNVIIILFYLRLHLSPSEKKKRFYYKSITGNKDHFFFKRNIVLDCLVFAFIIFLYALSPKASQHGVSDNIRIPSYEKSDNSWTNIKKASQNNSSLVQIDDYISHVIYQDLYQYGFGEFLPELEQEISTEKYLKNGGKFKVENETRLIFTESYYYAILQDIPKRSAALLLGSSDFLNFITYAPPSGGDFKYISWWQYLAAMLITLLPFIIFYLSLYKPFRRNTYNFIIRRKKKFA